MRARWWRGYVLVIVWIGMATGPWARANENCAAAEAMSTSCAFADLADAFQGARPFLVEACTRGLMPPCGGSASESFSCPGEFVTREDMAVFLERLYRYEEGGPPYQPPAATGIFSDVPATYCLAGWIEQLKKDNIASGCGGNNYCPFLAVTRWQMAVFLARVVSWRGGGPIDWEGTVDGQYYNCRAGGISLFADVPAADSGCRFIHYVYAKRITRGCQGEGQPLRYCPDQLIPREQMAVFLVRARNCFSPAQCGS